MFGVHREAIDYCMCSGAMSTALTEALDAMTL
jgi:hypothetical protein